MRQHLTGRGVVKVSGPDAATLLNGLLTNDVTKAGPETAIYAALLTPQGKYLFDLFVTAPDTETFLLDVSRPAEFAKRLMMYRLRSQVTIEDCSQALGVFAIWGQGDTGPANTVQDPRLTSLGARQIAALEAETPETGYHAHCLNLGVPDPALDLLVEKDFVLEGLFDELNGVDFHKGCYVGQEMTSRMKRRTSVKNKLCRVRYEGPPPAFETPILADGWEVGRMRSGLVGVGMALIRFDRVESAHAQGHPLLAGNTTLTCDPPPWLIKPEASG